MQASACEPRNLRKSSRLMKFSCDGSIVSAETSYGLPRIVALAPRTSPRSAILTIRGFPSGRAGGGLPLGRRGGEFRPSAAEDEDASGVFPLHEQQRSFRVETGELHRVERGHGA